MVFIKVGQTIKKLKISPAATPFTWSTGGYGFAASYYTYDGFAAPNYPYRGNANVIVPVTVTDTPYYPGYTFGYRGYPGGGNATAIPIGPNTINFG